jgi:hypothetical protein
MILKIYKIGGVIHHLRRLRECFHFVRKLCWPHCKYLIFNIILLVLYNMVKLQNLLYLT